MNNYPIYGVDTVALLSYFTDKLGSEGRKIFIEAEESDVILLIPQIVIGEMIYTILNEREIFGEKIPKEKLSTILITLHQSPSFLIKLLSLKGWNIVLNSNISELHDRMIVATCKQENVDNLITLDNNITISNEINSIW